MADTENLVHQVFLEITGLSPERCVELLGDLISLTVESSLHLPDVAASLSDRGGLRSSSNRARRPQP